MTPKAFIFLVAFGTTWYANGQTSIQQKKVKIYTDVDEPPQPTFDLAAYIFKNIRADADSCFMSRVVVSFIIDEKGNVYDTKIIRSGCDAVSKSVLHTINQMPKWKPGLLNGKPVRCAFTLPILITPGR